MREILYSLLILIILLISYSKPASQLSQNSSGVENTVENEAEAEQLTLAMNKDIRQIKSEVRLLDQKYFNQASLFNIEKPFTLPSTGAYRRTQFSGWQSFILNPLVFQKDAGVSFPPQLPMEIQRINQFGLAMKGALPGLLQKAP